MLKIFVKYYIEIKMLKYFKLWTFSNYIFNEKWMIF